MTVTEERLLAIFIALGFCSLVGAGLGVALDAIVPTRFLAVGVASGTAAAMASASIWGKEGMSRSGSLYFVSGAAGFAAWLTMIFLSAGA